MRGSRRAPALLAMGVPKRKVSGGQDGVAAPAGAAKRTRIEELTGVRFKAQLRDPQGPGPGECRGEESARLRGDLQASSVCAGPPCADAAAPFRSEGQSLASRFAVGKPRPGCRGVQGHDLLDFDSFPASTCFPCLGSICQQALKFFLVFFFFAVVRKVDKCTPHSNIYGVLTMSRGLPS